MHVSLIFICFSLLFFLVMQQNFNSNLMRQMQMQQQFGNVNQPPSSSALQNAGLNMNTNALMNAFQSAPPQGGQPPFFDVHRAENILAAAIAAANNNAAAQQNLNSATQQTQQPLQSHQFQATTYGLEGLGDFNPLVQQAHQQQNAGQTVAFNDIRRQSLGGLGGFGGLQQLANIGQAQQQQQGQQNLSQPQTHQQQLHSLHQSNQASSNHSAFGAAWAMGAMGQANVNAQFGADTSNLLKNAFSQGNVGAGPLFGDPNNPFEQHMFGAPAPQPGNGPSAGMLPPHHHQLLHPASFPPTFQGPPPKRRSSSLSSGSLSPIGKQKNIHGTQRSGFSNLFPPDLNHVGSSNDHGEHGTSKKQKMQDMKKKRAKSFPEKLLEAMMEHSDEEAVAWLPDGKSFVVVNPDLFCNDILNQVFKESKYASFVRKLHRWGFVRLTSGTGTDCFHHPMFQRNRKEMAAKISCAPRQGDKDKPEHQRHPASKPPSLAGVERFIRAKVVAAAASAAANADEMIKNDLEGEPAMIKNGLEEEPEMIKNGLEEEPEMIKNGLEGEPEMIKNGLEGEPEMIKNDLEGEPEIPAQLAESTEER
jgi:hypothetical protein